MVMYLWYVVIICSYNKLRNNKYKMKWGRWSILFLFCYYSINETHTHAYTERNTQEFYYDDDDISEKEYKCPVVCNISYVLFQSLVS